MEAKEFSRLVRTQGLYEKAKKTLCAFSDGSIFIDGDLEELEKEAAKSKLEIFIMKDNRKKKESKPEKSE